MRFWVFSAWLLVHARVLFSRHSEAEQTRARFLSFRLGLRFNIYRLDITKLFLCLKKMATTNEAISSLEEAVRMLG